MTTKRKEFSQSQRQGWWQVRRRIQQTILSLTVLLLFVTPSQAQDPMIHNPLPAVPKLCLYVTGHSWDHYLLFAMTEINSGRYANNSLPHLSNGSNQSSSASLLPLDYEILHANPTGTFVEGEAQLQYQRHYENCSIFVGPAWTTQLSAIGELATLQGKPIVSGGATSVIFRQDNFGFVSRVIPSDEGLLAALVELCVHFQFPSINLVYFNDDYGRRLTEEMTRRAEGLFLIHQQLSFTADTTDDLLDQNVIDKLIDSPTQVTFVATTILPLARLLNRAGQRGLYQHHVFLCPAAPQVIDDLDPMPAGGLWGLAYAPAVQPEDDLAIRYLNKNVTPHAEARDLLGDDYDVLTYWGAYGYDATLAAAVAVQAAYAAPAPPTGADLLFWLRQQETVGNTGILRMDDHGDRVGARIPLLGVANGRLDTFAVYEYGVGVTFVNDNNDDGTAPLSLWPNGATTMPDNLFRFDDDANSAVDEATERLLKRILIPTAVCAIAMLLSVSLLLYQSQRQVRDVKRAPKSGACCLVFTDIESSSTLWGVAPAAMSAAIDTHHAVIRQCIVTHGAYEVKTIGDSFMIAVASAAQAVALAVDMQDRLYQASWDPAIDRAYRDMLQVEEQASGRQSPQLWSGLRVRASVHHGEPDIVLDEVTKGYDYYGTVVNEAARIEALAHGGQTVVSEAVKTALTHVPAGVQIEALGSYSLRGCPGMFPLYQVTPDAFAGRQFPPLRTGDAEAKDKKHDDPEDEDDGLAHLDFLNHYSADNSADEVSSVASTSLQSGLYLQQEQWLQTLFSIFKPTKRRELVQVFCKAWRVKGEAQLVKRISKAQRALRKKNQMSSLDSSARSLGEQDAMLLINANTTPTSSRLNNLKKNRQLSLILENGGSTLPGDLEEDEDDSF